jgi:hypothetical protein
MIYKVKITEYLSRIIEVEVDDNCDEDAIMDDIKSDYYNCNIILNAEDFDDVEFEKYYD